MNNKEPAASEAKRDMEESPEDETTVEIDETLAQKERGEPSDEMRIENLESEPDEPDERVKELESRLKERAEA